jgi:hypothetical protein
VPNVGFCDEPQPNCRALEQVKEIENGKTLERGEGFLFWGQHWSCSKRAPFPWTIHMLSTGLITRINNTGNATPFRGGTCAKKPAALRLIFSVYTSLSSSYSVEALPTR